MTDTLPPALAAAISAAQATLVTYTKLADALAATSRTIPAALADESRTSRELGAAEVEGLAVEPLRHRLDAIRGDRLAAMRQRRAASDQLVELEAELRAARTALDQAQAEYAGTVIADFHRRWGEACGQLGVLMAEARQLSELLHTSVTASPPFTTALNVATDRHQVRFTGGLVEPPPLPPALAQVTGVNERVIQACALVGSIKQAAELDARHYALARIRPGQPATLAGTFVVTRAFSHLGTEFQIGALVDRSVAGDGLLHRLQTARSIQLTDTGAEAAA